MFVRATYCVFILLLLLIARASAYSKFNDKPEFFIEHLHKDKYAIDSNANAVVLYESAGFSLLKTAGKGWHVVKNIRRVIKILNKKGINEANVAVFYINSSFGGMEIINAETYNLVDGKYDRQEMNVKNITKDGVGGMMVGKFSLPGVKEGSVIDYTYRINEAFSYVFGEWEFQEKIPKLYSEVKGNFHLDFKIVINTQVRRNFVQFDDSRNDVTDSLIPEYYTASLNSSLGAEYSAGKWVRRNIPAYVEEPYNYNVKNYTEKIMFQATATMEVQRTATTISWTTFDVDSWAKVNSLFERRISDFNPLGADVDFVKSIVKQIAKDEKDSLLLAKKIFRYVRDSFESLDYFDFGSIKDVIHTKSGSQTDINLFLMTLLKAAGYQSNAIVLSTRDRLRINKTQPLLDRLNYIACQLKCNGETYYLDATRKYTPFGSMPQYCYNGFAWVITDKGYSIDLAPNLLKDKTAVIIKTENAAIDDYRLSVKQYYGQVRGVEQREKWLKDTTAIKKDIRDILRGIIGAELKSYSIKGLNNPDTALVLDYEIKIDWSNADIIQFVPSFFNYFVENPFKLTKRNYPIEMPYAVENIYSLNMQLPTGTSLEEEPNSITYKLDDENLYKYMFSYDKENNRLQLNTKVIMQRTFFDVAEYDGLREFVNSAIAQQQKSCLIKKSL